MFFPFVVNKGVGKRKVCPEVISSKSQRWLRNSKERICCHLHHRDKEQVKSFRDILAKLRTVFSIIQLWTRYVLLSLQTFHLFPVKSRQEETDHCIQGSFFLWLPVEFGQILESWEETGARKEQGFQGSLHWLSPPGSLQAASAVAAATLLGINNKSYLLVLCVHQEWVSRCISLC